MWLLAELRPFGWLCCVAACCLLATFVVPIAVLLLSADKDRKEAAKEILDRHPLTRKMELSRAGGSSRRGLCVGFGGGRAGW
jgi:hypothetical protein